ncbi:MAG: SprT-like domain-containing protein [Chthoniobacteraceae bacterium]
MMQLDFLTKLVARVRREPVVIPPQPPAIPKDGDAALTAQAHEFLRELDCAGLVARVVVRWNPRMRSTAGLANYQHSLVTLNPKLAQFGDAEIDKTLRHELAHLLAHFRAGRRRIAPHGAEWKQACRDLGLPDERRCHDLPLPRRKVVAKHTYHCPECRLDIHRVRPFRRKVACLACCRAHSRGRYDEKFRLVKTK